MQDLDCPIQTDVQALALEQPICSNIIFKTLKSMKRNKAHGPDGFTVEFFLSCRDIVGPNFCNAILYFFNTSVMYPEINSTSIALIPKVPTPVSMKDFRPISLCSIAYKCIAKIIANRMKLVMPNLINMSQSAFIPGHNISDNVLMAQELFRGYTRETGSPKCALKIDLHKAFDSIR